MYRMTMMRWNVAVSGVIDGWMLSVGDTIRIAGVCETLIGSQRRTPELQRAHDQLVGIILAEVPFPDVGLTMRDLNLMASVLCWCLQHDHNEQFARKLQAIETDLAAKGFALQRPEKN